MIPDINPSNVSKIYQGFLLDKIEQISGISGNDNYIAYTPISAKAFFKNIVPDNFTLLPQRGKDLGERLSNISNMLFEKGYGKVIITNSDSPNLPSDFISSSLNYLDEKDIVLGPCEDGGYYLVGLNQHEPEIFMDIPWSTSQVTKITKQKAIARGRSIFLNKKWYDVDTKEDLIRLKNDLDKCIQDPKNMYFCARTHKIITKIDITI
jgi:rSAM/selenodomain-associated transferase 1